MTDRARIHIDSELEEELLLEGVQQQQGWERVLRLMAGGVELWVALGLDSEDDLHLPDAVKATVEEKANELADLVALTAQKLAEQIATVIREHDDA